MGGIKSSSYNRVCSLQLGCSSPSHNILASGTPMSIPSRFRSLSHWLVLRSEARSPQQAPVRLHQERLQKTVTIRKAKSFIVYVNVLFSLYFPSLISTTMADGLFLDLRYNFRSLHKTVTVHKLFAMLYVWMRMLGKPTTIHGKNAPRIITEHDYLQPWVGLFPTPSNQYHNSVCPTAAQVFRVPCCWQVRVYQWKGLLLGQRHRRRHILAHQGKMGPGGQRGIKRRQTERWEETDLCWSSTNHYPTSSPLTMESIS